MLPQSPDPPMIWLACHAISVQLESPQLSGSPYATAQLLPVHVEVAFVLDCWQPVSSAPDQMKHAPALHLENCDEKRTISPTQSLTMGTLVTVASSMSPAVPSACTW